MKLERARVGEAAAIAALRVRANQRLTATYGPGHWSGNVTDRWVRYCMRNAHVYVMRRRGRVIATLTLAEKKPWSVDRAVLTAVPKRLYLTGMAVDPAAQRQGIGRACLQAAFRIVRDWPADALCLDAYDAPAGAGPFYKVCGFRQVGRGRFRKVPLIYLEWLKAGTAAAARARAGAR